MSRKELLNIILINILVSIAVAMIFGSIFISWLKNNPEYFVAVKGVQLANIDSSSNIVVDVVKKASPAVVAITVSKNIPVYERYFQRVPGSVGDFFNFIIPQYRQRGVQKQEVGGGSGFLVSSDGYIVTNRHVVDDPNAEYTVFMNDGKKYVAEVMSRDENIDLAILKINGSGFAHLTFGNSDKLEVGQSVIAIGNALAEFRNTVSLGIVSGLSRSIVASDRAGSRESLDQLIQTDAAVNPGNSGGPLINLDGEVIGVNVAIAAEAENIGFALSSNIVKSAVDSVRKR